MKQQKFLIRKRHKNVRRVSGEKEKNTRKTPNNSQTSRGTLNTKGKKNWKLLEKK